MVKIENVVKGVAVLGLVSLLSYTGGQASAPYMVEEYAQIKNELWRYKEALAGVIKKVIFLDRKVSELERRVTGLEEDVALVKEEEEERRTCTVVASWLRVRECPSTTCRIVGALRRETKVRYSATVDGWRKMFSPTVGYVSAKYCR